MSSLLLDYSLPADPWIYPLLFFGVLLLLGLFTVDVRGFTINGSKGARISAVVASFVCLAIGLAGEGGLLSKKAAPEPVPAPPPAPCSDVIAEQLDEGELEILWKGYIAIGDELSNGNDAIKMYEKSIALRPNEPEGSLRWAETLNRLRKYDDAVGKFQRADNLVKVKRQARPEDYWETQAYIDKDWGYALLGLELCAAEQKFEDAVHLFQTHHLPEKATDIGLDKAKEMVRERKCKRN